MVSKLQGVRVLSCAGGLMNSGGPSGYLAALQCSWRQNAVWRHVNSPGPHQNWWQCAGCVDANGSAYVWGPLMRQALLEAAWDADIPQQIEGIQSAVALALGGRHLLVQWHGGRVASFGANENGVLGIGSDNVSTALTPTLLPKVSFQQVCASFLRDQRIAA